MDRFMGGWIEGREVNLSRSESYNLSADGSHQNISMGEEWLPWVRRSSRRPKRRWPDADVLVSARGLIIFAPSLRWHSCVWGPAVIHQLREEHAELLVYFFRSSCLATLSPTPGSGGTSRQSPPGKTSNTSKWWRETEQRRWMWQEKDSRHAGTEEVEALRGTPRR